MLKRFLCVLAAMLMLLSACALSETADGSLCELAKDDGFQIGAALSYNQLRDGLYLKLIKKHFNSVTPTNELKAYTLLDQRASKQSKDGSPVMNYTMADQMLTFAQENGIAVRGHVLVWDAYMCDWFFREGYDSKNPYADQRTLMFRLESYIDQVMSHFEQNFQGLVYCWDVVNEAVGDSATEYAAGDERHIRTMRNGQSNPFYELIGPDYVELSFLYARNTAEKLHSDVKLFYNDYNAFMPEKAKAMRALVDSINSYAKDDSGNARRLIDGVGMQGYIGGYGTQSGCLNDSDLPKIKAAIEGYAEKGVEVQLTEMAVRTYENDEATMAKHAEFYGKLFKVFKSVNRNNENKPLTAVTIWGINDCPGLPKDNYVYKLNSPYGGLFTEKNEEKFVIQTLLQVLGEE